MRTTEQAHRLLHISLVFADKSRLIRIKNCSTKRRSFQEPAEAPAPKKTVLCRTPGYTSRIGVILSGTGCYQSTLHEQNGFWIINIIGLYCI